MDSKDWLQPSASSSCTGWLLLQTTVIVVGSSFQFGYNTGVINAPQANIERFINESHYDRFGEYINKSSLTILWSSTVAIFAVGGMVGSVSAGPLSQKLGRKVSLLCNNAVALIGACLMGFSKLANAYEMLMVGRFVIGLNCGINTVIAPMFLTEISPVQHRGMLGTLNQLGIVSSILISQVLGLPSVLGNESGWPILLGLTGVFAVFQLIVLPFCPESPRYLLLYKDNERAAKSGLRKLRGPYSDIDEECSVMLEEYHESSKETSIGRNTLFGSHGDNSVCRSRHEPITIVETTYMPVVCRNVTSHITPQKSQAHSQLLECLKNFVQIFAWSTPITVPHTGMISPTDDRLWVVAL